MFVIGFALGWLCATAWHQVGWAEGPEEYEAINGYEESP